MQPTTRKPRQDGTRAPIQPFDANEALFLIRMLAYNLVRRWSQVIRSWRMSWMREAERDQTSGAKKSPGMRM